MPPGRGRLRHRVQGAHERGALRARLGQTSLPLPPAHVVLLWPLVRGWARRCLPPLQAHLRSGPDCGALPGQVDEVAVKLVKADKPSPREMALFHKEVPAPP